MGINRWRVGQHLRMQENERRCFDESFFLLVFVSGQATGTIFEKPLSGIGSNSPVKITGHTSEKWNVPMVNKSSRFWIMTTTTATVPVARETTRCWSYSLMVTLSFLVGYLTCSYDVAETFTTIATSTATTQLGAKSELDIPKEFPRRVISVFGLESSGTTFVANTLRVALGGHGRMELHYMGNNHTELQHISLPWGWWRDGLNHSLDIVPLVPPQPCMISPGLYAYQMERQQTRGVPDCCRAVNITKFPPIPQRFFVNITTHVRWYRSVGIPSTAVVVVRDDHMHLPGKLKHAGPVENARQEDIVGKALIAGAMEALSSPSEIILVSYESLMSLREPYLLNLYSKLGIQSTFVPEFKDGNAKYVDSKYQYSLDKEGGDP